MCVFVCNGQNVCVYFCVKELTTNWWEMLCERYSAEKRRKKDNQQRRGEKEIITNLKVAF